MRLLILALAFSATQFLDAFQPNIWLPKNSHGQSHIHSTIISDLRTSNASRDQPAPSEPTDTLPPSVSKSILDAEPEKQMTPATPTTAPRRVGRKEAASVSNPITIVETSRELTDLMQGNNSEQLTVVLFHAHYCKICQRAGVQYKRLAATEYSNPDQVRFAKIESMVLPKSADTLRSLGVTKFPFVQIYRRGQCVASFSTGPSHMFLRRIRDTLNICLERTPEEWDQFISEFAEPIEENQNARKSLLLSP